MNENEAKHEIIFYILGLMKRDSEAPHKEKALEVLFLFYLSDKVY